MSGLGALPVFFVNAFTGSFYRGNTAAVVILPEYPADDALRSLAAEFNFSETAFLKPLDTGSYHLRWFTPEVEVPLCGHATLASAQALFSSRESGTEALRFSTLSGELSARRAGNRIQLDLPADEPQPREPDPVVSDCLAAVQPLATLAARGTRNLMLVYSEAADIIQMRPDFSRLAALDDHSYFGIAVTAPDSRHDYICRYFAPWEGINEDPVTGSAQTFLAPYWSARLGKRVLQGFQASVRGGEFECERSGDRILLRGEAFIYLRGELAPGWQG